MPGVVGTAIPETQYALNGDIHLAYQTLGQGPPDILSVIAGPGSHVEQIWEEQGIARTTRRLASLSRIILFDQRGSCMFDPASPHDTPTNDAQCDDIRALLDTVG